jgi:hypothetical protein
MLGSNPVCMKCGKPHLGWKHGAEGVLCLECRNKLSSHKRDCSYKNVYGRSWEGGKNREPDPYLDLDGEPPEHGTDWGWDDPLNGMSADLSE